MSKRAGIEHRWGFWKASCSTRYPTDDQFKAFIDKTMTNSFGRWILNEIKMQVNARPAEKQPQNGFHNNLPGRANTSQAEDNTADADYSEDDGYDETESGALIRSGERVRSSGGPLEPAGVKGNGGG